MPTYTIHSIWPDSPAQWGDASRGGPFDAYVMNLYGPDGSQHANVGLNKKAGNPPPAAGATIDGEITTVNGGRLKFKATPPSQGGGVQARPAGGGGGAPSGGGGGFPPHVQASIVWQSSQKVAADIMAVTQVPNGAEAALALHRELTTAIAKDVLRVWEQHGGPAGFGAPAAPAATQTPPPAAQGGDFGAQAPAGNAAPTGFGAAPGGGGFGGTDDNVPF